MNIRYVFICGCVPLCITAGRAMAEEKPGPFDAQLLEVGKEYQRYGRVDDETRWAPFLCRLPSPSTARFSQSDDAVTHGEKLYFLFAKDRASYVALGARPQPGAGGAPNKGAATPPSEQEQPAPTSETTTRQAIVKEAWKAKEAPASEKPQPVYEAFKKLGDLKASADGKPAERVRGTYLPYAKKEGKLYKAHEKAGLYIMLQLDPATADTDEGWVYGTLTPDGKTVTSAGRIESCMKCHQDAPHGRLFGLAPRSPELKGVKALDVK